MNKEMIKQLQEWAEIYNNPKYFEEDPIAFPRHFNNLFTKGEARKEDVEIAAIFAAHFAWGRRAMIVRDCGRLFDEMNWSPFDYIMAGDYKDEDRSIHRTIKWCDVAGICTRLRDIYNKIDTIENLSVSEIRTLIFGQKPDKNAPNKKINMMRRWLVRNDGKVDLGLWTNSDPKELKIPLDVHVHRIATEIGLTDKKAKSIKTVDEITNSLNEIFPGDPCKGDFALFGYGVTHAK